MIDPDKTIGEMLGTLQDLGKVVWLESADDPHFGRVTVVVAVGQRALDLLDLTQRFVKKHLEMQAAQDQDHVDPEMN